MTPWVLRLLFANVLMFGLQMLHPAVTEELAFVPWLILGKPWTVITYMFLHGSPTHLLFNMLGLYFFGPHLEAHLGSRQFLMLYFVSGLMAAALSSAFSPFSSIIGASGAVYGVFFGFAYFWPRERIFVWGILPIEARWLVLIMTALSLYGGVGDAGGNIAHFAHLGGFVGGYLYLRFITQRRVAREQSPSIPKATTSDLDRWMKIRREGMHEVNRAELERILDKIKTSGASSLTPGEREFLDRFSE